MKIAIIGSGPVAILTAFHFDQLGADVILFQRSPLGGNLNLIKKEFPEFKIKYNNVEVNVLDFFKEVVVPAGLELEKYNLTKSGDVLRVHKRFVHPTEEILGKTRMHDLFRVIYSTNPKENILRQIEEHPEMFEKLGAEVIESLHKPVESFADFDIVIEATGLGREANPMGASLSLALNENNIKDSGLIFYEKEIFEKFELSNQKNITLVGEGKTAQLALLKLKNWLFSDKSRTLHWVTYKPQESLNSSWEDKELQKFFDELRSNFEKSKVEFEEKIRAWRDLEDYEKAKIPKPVEPKAPLMIYSGYDVTSVDRLLDRDEVYVTIESPSFRDHSLKVNDIVTIASDAVLVARGVKEGSLSHGVMISNEPGYYEMKVENLNDLNEKILEVQNDILKFFSKA